MTTDLDPADRASLEHLANIGELAGPLAHEITNFLNVILLQVSLLETMMPEDQRADLLEIRRQGNRAAELVNRFQEQRHSRPAPATPVDLQALVNAVVRNVRAEHADVVEIETRLEGDAPHVMAVPSDLERLLHFLIVNAARAAESGGKQVIVSTSADRSRVVLHVEDNGPTPSEKALLYLFEPGQPGRDGVETLELSACRSMVRRLGGTITAEARPGGGVRVSVELEAS